jgi:hypothetical protein
MSGLSTLSDKTSQLEFNALGTTTVFHSWQRCPNDTWWSDASPLGGECLQLAMGPNADGRLEVFYIKDDNCIYHRFQAVPNGPFQDEYPLGGTPAKQVTVGKNADGRLELFYIGTDDCIYHKFQAVPNGPFQAEYALGGMTAQQITVGKNADGRLEVFYIGTDNCIYHKFQGVPNGPFHDEYALGGMTARQITVGRNADGRMEVFYIGTDDALYHKSQGVPNGPFTAEYAMSAAPAQQVLVASNADARLEVLFVGMDNHIYYQYQCVSNGPFSACFPLPFLGEAGRLLDLGNNQDGRIEFFYQGSLAANGPIVVRGLSAAGGELLVVPQQVPIQVVTKTPVNSDISVKVSSVTNPYFADDCAWLEDTSVVSVEGTGEALIPAGQCQAGFTLTPVKAGFAWIKVEADGYLQVQDAGPEWTIPGPQMADVLVKDAVHVDPAAVEIDQGNSVNLTIRFDSPPAKDFPVRLLLAYDSPLQGYISFQPDVVIVPAGQTTAMAKVTALKVGPATGDLGFTPLWAWSGAACHITVKGVQPPVPPPPAPSTKTYTLQLQWQIPWTGLIYVTGSMPPVPGGILQKVCNHTAWPWRYKLWFPTQPGATTDDAFDDTKGFLLDVGQSATPAQLNRPAALNSGLLLVATPSSVDQPAQGAIAVDLVYTAP